MSRNILLGTAIVTILVACAKKEPTETFIEETIETVDSFAIVEDFDEVVDNTPDFDTITENITTYEEPELTYERAEEINTSTVWKRFLEENPNHSKRKEISEKIIRLEVDEILRDTETGMMPSFDNHSSKYSSTSSVKISNDTGCGLTVRYSGTEAKMLDIPNGSTKTVSLKSGNYKITASACGYNYAGIENLHGDYSSTFYISTTRRY